jgi:uncharacterized protein (DUF58 family)
VRAFENRPSGDWWILLDFEQAVQAGQGAQSTIEHGVILAASLADRGLRLGRAVGFAAHGQHLVWLPPKHSEHQRWQMLQELALLEPGSFPLQSLIGLLEAKFTADASLVIITPNDNAGWLASLLPLVWRGAVATVLLLDPSAFEPTRAAQMIAPELEKWGVYLERITPDLLNRPEARPGVIGRPDLRVTPSGRAVQVGPLRESSWKGLQ